MIRLRSRLPVRDDYKNPERMRPECTNRYLQVHDSLDGEKAYYGGKGVGLCVGDDEPVPSAWVDVMKWGAQRYHEQWALFTYVVLDPAPDGRQRVALRAYDGHFLRVVPEENLVVADASLTNEPGVALTVDEPVSKRVVMIVRELPDKATVTPLPPTLDQRATILNPTDHEVTKSLAFAFTTENSSSIGNKVGTSLSLGAEYEVGFNIMGGTASVKYSANLTTDYERTWGATKTESQHVEDTTTMTVPAHTTLSAHAVATRQRRDLPFQYIVGRWSLTGEQLPLVPEADTEENSALARAIRLHHEICDGEYQAGGAKEGREIPVEQLPPTMVFRGLHRRVETLSTDVALEQTGIKPT
jgi:hypothetical protein